MNSDDCIILDVPDYKVISAWWLDVVHDSGMFNIREWLTKTKYGFSISTDDFGEEVWMVKKHIYESIKMWIDNDGYAGMTLRNFLRSLGVC